MAHYFFNFRNGTEYVEDEDGVDLADDDAAWAEAVAGLRDIFAGDILQGVLHIRSRIEVDDQNHQPVMSVGFDEAVRLHTQ